MYDRRGNGRLRMKTLTLLVSTVVLLSCSADLDTHVVPEAEEAADFDLGLMSRIHFNIQVRDFDASRAFYRMLGFTAGQGGFPTTNTHAMARSLGMYDLCTYEVDNIEIIGIPGSWGPATIDLIQFNHALQRRPPVRVTDACRHGLCGPLDD